MADGLFQRRIVIGAVFCVAAFALVGLRLVDVTLLHGAGHGGYQDRAVGARADLVDRNGRLLARDLPVKDLYARPHEFWNKTQAAHDLAEATGADERRLRQRAQDSADEVTRRMAKAADELSHWPEYDYVLINESLDDTVRKVEAILLAERSRRARQIGLHEFVKGLREGQ